MVAERKAPSACISSDRGFGGGRGWWLRQENPLHSHFERRRGSSLRRKHAGLLAVMLYQKTKKKEKGRAHLCPLVLLSSRPRSVGCVMGTDCGRQRLVSRYNDNERNFGHTLGARPLIIVVVVAVLFVVLWSLSSSRR